MKQNVLQMFYRIAKFGISNCIEHAKMPVTIGKKHFCRFNDYYGANSASKFGANSASDFTPNGAT
jgi:hypothetical protein